jgi:hypothetical protein
VSITIRVHYSVDKSPLIDWTERAKEWATLSALISGQILIKNWNPLSITNVTEDRSLTVQDVLGDLMNTAILKIHIRRYNVHADRSFVHSFVRFEDV